MMFDSSILILIAIASLCFGFLFGYIMRGFIRKSDRSEAQVEFDKSLKAETAKKKAPNRHYQEVAQLWRDDRDRRLVFQIENKYYKRDSDLSDSEKELLLKVVMDFYHWLEPDQTMMRKGDIAPQLNQSQNPELSATPVTTMVLKDLDNTPKIDLSPVKMLAQALQSEVRSTKSSQSMVTQVDAILQEKLHHAGMKNWAIRLTEFPQRGMVVMVGLEHYNGIDEVPYEQVRSIIRESVSEWEQRVEIGNFVQ